MRIERKFTKDGVDVFSTIEWTTRSSKISNLDGSVVFEMNDAKVPADWSQLATDIMVSKYFRKAGVPQLDDNGQVIKDEDGKVVTGPERSAQQVIHRLAGCWRYWGETHGYFDSAKDAQAFYDELSFMMLNQMCAPNSPQWFNTGLNWAYDINGPAQGHWYTDDQTGETQLAKDAYTHPQPHACFIQSINDSLVNEGGIMDLWTREARLFKYGSGTGTNFSNIRAENEPLSGGGKSSGLMSFLKIGDRAAGAIKSGGTTRRAAKMVCLDLDHPDIPEFVNWKVREEIKVAALVEGFKAIKDAKTSEADQETVGETAERLGLKLDYDFNGESYQTVSGQNSNNSVRIPNEFFMRVDEDGTWETINRTNGEVAKSFPARQLWDQINYAAWRCADPGVQFDTTINEWHTCPQAGRINASNPCSEYMFLDNTACNLASFNLLKFYNAETGEFDLERYEHGIKLWTMVLEISVLMAAFPSKEIARLSYEYRTLGLGYANIGAMLMQAGIAYDSDEGRAICGALTAILTGRSYATSAQMAAEHGPFPGYHPNKDHMLRVIRNHRRAAYGVSRDTDIARDHELGDYEGLQIKPVPVDSYYLNEGSDEFRTLGNASDILRAARASWDDALKLGQEHGYRNAQTTVIAPTGTIGLLMDCDTTGVEPDFSLVKFKKLAGGGYFKIANQSLKPSLKHMGYDEQQVKDIISYVMGSLHLDIAFEKGTFADFLKDKGMNDADLKKITDALPTVFEIGQAFTVWTVGEDCIKRLGLEEQAKAADFNLLKALGLTAKQIVELNYQVCGTQTIEGAPHLTDEDLKVFDCANTCGPLGKRFIHAHGHIRMMAAAQPFISGAISKTINLPNEASVTDIANSYRMSWDLGLKANALYRDGCKLSQPLNSKMDADEEVDDDENIAAGKDEVAQDVADAAKSVAAEAPKPIEKIIEKIIERPMRRRLPDTRRSLTHKFNVAGHEGYITVGLYEDGCPGELFITMAKEGSTIGGLMDSLGTAISIALQYGVPTESLVTKFTHQRFEPAGMTHNRDIPFAKSLVDYIFRWLGMEFIPGYRAANAPQRPADKKPATAKAQSKAQSVAEHKGSNNAGSSNGNGSSKSKATETVKLDKSPRMQSTLGKGGRLSDDTDASSGKSNNGNGSNGSKESSSDGTATAAMTAAMTQMQADAPACDVCGTITVRSGTCYKCLNCGASMGCS
ncbi:MAG: adenosylcobalamin-dependent ribonucleoside-diphosphate reductase [Phycisphaeraceae bacterium JB051]